VRNYVLRVRKILARLAIPCDLVNRPGRGYSLTFRNADWRMGADRHIRRAPSKSELALLTNPLTEGVVLITRRAQRGVPRECPF
jgi:hypothetical protein